MTDSRTPIQSQLAQFLVGGARHKRGYVLLHPDRLTAVVSPADIVGYLGGPMVFVGFASPLFHVIGWLGVAIGVLIGRQAGDAYNKVQAIRKAAAGGDGMTVIPLDLITVVRTAKSQGFGGLRETQTLVVTTAGGTEYGFHGKMAGWQADLASALAATCAPRPRALRSPVPGLTDSGGSGAMMMTRPGVSALWDELCARVKTGDRFADLSGSQAEGGPLVLSAPVATAGAWRTCSSR